jgi:hypothetical protein
MSRVFLQMTTVDNFYAYSNLAKFDRPFSSAPLTFPAMKGIAYLKNTIFNAVFS